MVVLCNHFRRSSAPLFSFAPVSFWKNHEAILSLNGENFGHPFEKYCRLISRARSDFEYFHHRLQMQQFGLSSNGHGGRDGLFDTDGEGHIFVGIFHEGRLQEEVSLQAIHRL